ncbi:MAG: carotenoid biosynthesis protein [Nitrospira sp.]|nr:carotenoid biosynthesis protein [Nitrospira sp.]
MDIVVLLLKTIALRPYVFLFLAAFLYAGIQLIGWRRTWRFWLISWTTAFVCEYSSTRTGIPFGWYFYNGSTVGQELYIANVPFMDSISFSFLLYAAYCVALCLLLPHDGYSLLGKVRLKQLRFDSRESTRLPVLALTVFLFMFIDMVIDPIALRGDRWFLGKIYYYPDPGLHFGVPLANYIGWAVVGTLALAVYVPLERRLPPLRPSDVATLRLLAGAGLYYSVLFFNLGVTFWIGEWVMGLSGLFMHLPMLALLIRRIVELPPTLSPSYGGNVPVKN